MPHGKAAVVGQAYILYSLAKDFVGKLKVALLHSLYFICAFSFYG